MKRVFITGACGFIGKEVTLQFLRKGYGVIGAGLCKAIPKEFKSFSKKINIIRRDLDRVSFKNLCKDIDIFIHLAGYTPFGAEEGSYKKDEKIASRIVRYCKGDTKIIFLSGWVVYGKPKKLPVSENHPCHPINDYGKSKLAIEKILMKHPNVTVLRCCSVFGEGQTAKGAIPNFFKNVLQKKPIEVAKNIKREYVYIKDVTRAVEKAVNSPPGIYNIGIGKSYFLTDMAKIISKLFGNKKIIEKSSYEQLRDFYFDIRKAKKILGYSPNFKVPSTIKKIAKWWKQHHTTFIDLDGTLVSFAERYYQLHSFCMKKLNKEPLSKEEYQKNKRKGIPEKIILKKMLSGKEFKEYEKNRIKFIEDPAFLKYDQLIPKIKKVLKELSKTSKIILITRRKNKRYCLEQLEKLKLKDLFYQIIIEKNKKRREIISSHPLFTKFSIIIGDSEEDMMAGKALNIETISVLTGARNKSFLMKYKPDRVISDITGLLK